MQIETFTPTFAYSDQYILIDIIGISTVSAVEHLLRAAFTDQETRKEFENF